jgi:hypothetical protein
MRKHKRHVHATHRQLLEFLTVVPSCTTATPWRFWRHLEQKQKARAKSPTEFKNNQSQNHASLVQHVGEAKFNQM